MSKVLNGVRPRSGHHDGVGPQPYIITPRDEFECIGGKPTLLTDYHIDEIVSAMRRTTYDPDLMAKLADLRGEASQARRSHPRPSSHAGVRPPS